MIEIIHFHDFPINFLYFFYSKQQHHIFYGNSNKKWFQLNIFSAVCFLLVLFYIAKKEWKTVSETKHATCRINLFTPMLMTPIRMLFRFFSLFNFSYFTCMTFRISCFFFYTPFLRDVSRQFHTGNVISDFVGNWMIFAGLQSISRGKFICMDLKLLLNKTR